MSVTSAELESFHLYAAEKLRGGEAPSSLEDLVEQWRREREHSETVADIRQGIQDYQAGRAQPIAEAFDQVRDELGLGAV